MSSGRYFATEMLSDRCYNFNKRDMHNFSTRLQIFKDWPVSLPITAEQMAHAGFVYSGHFNALAVGFNFLASKKK